MNGKTAEKALRDMHRALYPEQYYGNGQRRPRSLYGEPSQWDAGTIEVIASILNSAMDNDGEGRADS